MSPDSPFEPNADAARAARLVTMGPQATPSTQAGSPRDPATPGTQAPLWRKLLPFAVALALIAFVLSRLDLRAFFAHLAAVNAPGFLAFGIIFVIALLSADSFATVIVYRRTVTQIHF